MYTEINTYDHAYNNGQFEMAIKIAFGGTGEPYMMSCFYTNKYGQLEKQERINYEGEVGKVYTDTFLYNYLGYKTEVSHTLQSMNITTKAISQKLTMSMVPILKLNTMLLEK